LAAKGSQGGKAELGVEQRPVGPRGVNVRCVNAPTWVVVVVNPSAAEEKERGEGGFAKSESAKGNFMLGGR